MREKHILVTSLEGLGECLHSIVCINSTEFSLLFAKEMGLYFVNICQSRHECTFYLYGRTSEARTMMVRLPWLFRTHA